MKTPRHVLLSLLAASTFMSIAPSVVYASSRISCEDRLMGRHPADPIVTQKLVESDTVSMSQLKEAHSKLESRIWDLKYDLDSDERKLEGRSFYGSRRPLEGEEREQMLERIDRRKVDLARARRDRDELKTEMERLESADRPRLVELAKKVLEMPSGGLMREELLSAQVLHLLSDNVVSLLVGGAETETAPEMHAESIKLAGALKERGYNVVYDADSPVAKDLATALGDFGIGVTTDPKKENLKGRTIAITNEYLRLRLFKHAKWQVTSADSINGLGLYLNTSRSEFSTDYVFVLDPKSEVKSDLSKTPEKMKKRDLGAKFGQIITVESAAQLLTMETDKKPVFRKVHATTRLKLNVEVDKLSYQSLFELLERTQDLARAFHPEVKGAVVFGSARTDKVSADLVYQTVRQVALRGTAISTGGAGGMMEIANTAAHDAGTASIGVPLTGSKSLSTEKSIASSVQTMTIPTMDYDVRIPTLLKDKQLVLFAPGGNGTMKELAATLIKAEGDPNWQAEIVFVDSDYYGDVVEWIRSLPISNSIKNRIHVIDKAEDILPIAEQIQARDPSFVQVTNVKPRSGRTKYEAKEKESKDSKGLSSSSSSSSSSISKWKSKILPPSENKWDWGDWGGLN